MSYIPNIRSFMKERIFATQQEEENPYYEGYISEEDAQCLAGYDLAMHDLETGLQNIDTYSEYLEECGIDDDRLQELLGVIESYMKDPEFDISSIEDVRIKLVLMVYEAFTDYLETMRNGMGVSMLDGLSDEEYEANVEKYKGGYKNSVLRLSEALDKGVIY